MHTGLTTGLSAPPLHRQPTTASLLPLAAPFLMVPWPHSLHSEGAPPFTSTFPLPPYLAHACCSYMRTPDFTPSFQEPPKAASAPGVSPHLLYGPQGPQTSPGGLLGLISQRSLLVLLQHNHSFLSPDPGRLVLASLPMHALCSQPLMLIPKTYSGSTYERAPPTPVTSPKSYSHSSASTHASNSLRDFQTSPGVGAQREEMAGPKI